MHSFSLIISGLALAMGSEAQSILETAGAFGALASSTVTNIGFTYIDGSVGVYGGSAITGFPPGFATGGLHSSDSTAVLAQGDAHNAYASLINMPYTSLTNLTGQPLGGMELSPGVYHFNTEAALDGTLTLNTGGDPNAQFVFQIGTTFTTAVGASMVESSGGSACNVIWAVGSSAGIGAGSTILGTILAYASAVVGSGAQSVGGFIALNAAVTLSDNRITSQQICA